MQRPPRPRHQGPPGLQGRRVPRAEAFLPGLVLLLSSACMLYEEPLPTEGSFDSPAVLAPYVGLATSGNDTREALWLPPGITLTVTGPLSLEVAAGGPCDAVLNAQPTRTPGPTAAPTLPNTISANGGWMAIQLPAGPHILSAESPCGSGVAVWTLSLPMQALRLEPTSLPEAPPKEPVADPGWLEQLWTRLVRPTPIPPTEKPPPRPSLILITIDTLRPDLLSPYGGNAGLTPMFSQLASQGRVYEQARAHAPWTGPSVAALMTGRQSAGLDRQAELAPTLPSLAEELHSAGYQTLAVLNNPRLAAGTGFERGFDRHVLLDSDDALVESFPELLASLLRRSPSPVFAWVHLLGPHRPLEPSEEDLQAAGWDPTLGEPILEDAETIGPEAQLPPREQERIRRLYTAEVHQADRQLAKLVKTLDATLPGATLAITSDHGEELFEHGSYGHGHALYRALLHVPLLLRGPGFAPGTREQALVRLCELAPTFLSLAQRPKPSSMLCDPLWERAHHPRSMAGNLIHGPKQVSVEGRRWKLLREEAGRPLALWKSNSLEMEDFSFRQPDVVKMFSREADAFIGRSYALLGPLRAVLTLSGAGDGEVTGLLRSTLPLSLLPQAPPGRYGRVEQLEEGKVWRVTGKLQPKNELGARFEVKLAARSDITGEAWQDGKPIPQTQWRVAGAPAQTSPFLLTTDSEGWRGETDDQASLRVDLWLEPRGEPPHEQVFSTEEREKLRALGYTD